MSVDPSYTVRLRNHAHDLDADAHLPAVEVPYDNAASGLAATDVQAAIDEIAATGGGGTNVWEPMIASDGTVMTDGLLNPMMHEVTY